MASHLLRIATSFGIVLTAYSVYALVAVPLIEPSADRVVVDSAEPPPVAAREDLKPYFPPGSWELNNPKVLESDRAKLLIKDYKNLPDGRVKLFPCTVLFFGDDPPGAETRSPPVILQAPAGAILKFDEPFDLKRAKIGRLIGGQLVGKVTIRRELSRPGAGDDLRITTRDIELTEDRVLTPNPVDFHFGPSYGSGREMTILLARKEKPGEVQKGMGITGVKSFQLQHDVRMHMLLGGKDPQRVVTGEPDNPPVRRGGDPPVEISCQGPFQFDLEKYVATFSDQVDVLRLNSNGPADQMNCELLTVLFARRDETLPTVPSAIKGKSARAAAPSLEARLVEARGDPVMVRSPSTGGQARCQRLEYEVKTGRISLSGAGTLQGAMPRNPAQKYQARWSRELRYEPQAAEPMMSLVGGAQVKISDIGGRAAATPQPASLSADEIHLWLHPTAKAGARGAPAAQPQTIAFGRQAGGDDIRPKRLLAQSAVRIDSAALVGATGLLEVLFVPASPAAPGATSDPAGEPARRQPGRGDAISRQQFKVAGSQMRVQFAVRGEQTELSDVLLDGNAELRESKTARPGEKPLLAKGDRLQLVGGDSPDSQVNVTGKPAYIEARGLSLSGANIQLQRRTNQLTINGPGRMTLPMTRDLNGQALSGEQKLEINWQAGMNFDGRSAVFERAVVARTARQLLRTERLEATLKQAIDLANPPNGEKQSQPAQIDQIVCSQGVFLESRTPEERGVASIERMQALDLAINQTTGGIDARGPGWVSSVRRGAPGGLLPKPAGTAAAKDPAAEKGAKADPDRLSFLGVNFARSITGNLHQRELTFADQVKTVYGPVADWEQKLDADNPEALGPEGVTMTCDQLVVREMAERVVQQAPGATPRGFLELEASGNTLVEGSTFTARAHRLTFAEKKSLLVLEGDGRGDAQLFRQPVPGGPTSQAAARRIMYWQSTNRVEIDDARLFDFGQFGLGAAKPGDNKSSKPQKK